MAQRKTNTRTAPVLDHRPRTVAMVQILGIKYNKRLNRREILTPFCTDGGGIFFVSARREMTCGSLGVTFMKPILQGAGGQHCSHAMDA